MNDSIPDSRPDEFDPRLRQAAFEFASDGIFISDGAGRYVDVNTRGCEMLGFSRQELLQMTIQDLIVMAEPGDVPPLLDELRSGRTVVRERRVRRKRGAPLLVEISARALPDGHLLGIVRDIQERKQLESRLAASENLNRSIVDTSPDAIAIVDLDGSLSMVSAGLNLLLGHDRDSNLLGQHFMTLVAPESREHAQSVWLSLLQEGKTSGVRFRLLTRDGRPLACEGFADVLRGDLGQPQAVLLLARDISASELAGAEIRKSEERYRLLFDSNPQPLWVYDVETLAFLAVNDAAVARYGYSRAEFLSMTIADIRPPEDVPRLLQNVAAVVDGLDEAGRWRHRKQDGTVIDVEITTHVMMFDGRRSELVQPIDITERLLAETRIRHLTRLYALLSQVNQVIVRMTDRDALLGELCRVAIEHGEFRMAWVGLLDERGDLLPVAHAGHEAGYLDEFAARALAANTPGPTGTALRNGMLNTCDDIATDPRMAPWREGALERGYRSSAAIPLLLGGAVVGTFNLYSQLPGSFDDSERQLLAELGQDISFALESMDAERKRREVEGALRESQARLGHIVDASPATIYSLAITDGELRPTWASENLQAALGYTLADVQEPGWWWARVHPEDRDRVSEGMPRLYAEDRLVHDYRLRGADGVFRWIHDELRLIRDEAGQPREVIGAWTDLSLLHKAEAERMALERQLLHAQKLESLGVLAGGIAHDFNNLLMAISGHIELAVQRPHEQGVEHLQQAARAAQIAADLTRQMLAYTGRGRFVIQEIDLNAVVRENLRLLGASIPKSIVLEVHFAGTLPPIEADAGQIQQVVMNLVTNAADAIGGGIGRITATTGVQLCSAEELRRSRVEVVPPSGEFVFLEIRDDGGGMEPKTLEHLFEPFFTTKATGRGLGMSAILGIVRAHHGAIFVDSAPAQGSCFRVLFPACASAKQQPNADRAPRSHASMGLRGTVLIVDDEPLMRDLTLEMLEHLGVQGVAVAGGVAVVKLFRERSAEIDAVIVDLTMPVMDGLAVMDELLAIRSDIPIILSSGYDEQEPRRRLPGGDAITFLHKPYSLERLRSVLETALCRLKD